MFDTYVSRNVTERVTESVTVHEHRAPTDESVKLLNELTEKALKNITHRFSTSNNTLQTSWAVYVDQPQHKRVALCKFVLNGKEHTLQVDIPEWEVQSKEELLGRLYSEVTERLAKEMLKPLFEEMSCKIV